MEQNSWTVTELQVAKETIGQYIEGIIDYDIAEQRLLTYFDDLDTALECAISDKISDNIVFGNLLPMFSKLPPNKIVQKYNKVLPIKRAKIISS